jgi:hypothetical protein
MEKKIDECVYWQKLRPMLKPSKMDDNWQAAFDLFEKRIKSKFLDPITLLIEHGNNEGTGFSVVSLECILIETFAAFKKGRIYNNRYCQKNDPPYQYKDCQKLFVDFLETEDIFKKYFLFDTIDQNDPLKFSASNFYVDVRCGLLHEGRTKKNWTINLKPKNEKGDILFGKQGNKQKVYRSTLYLLLVRYLHKYLKELCEESNNGNDIRLKFARKMDNLYNFKPDKARFEWWIY